MTTESNEKTPLESVTVLEASIRQGKADIETFLSKLADLVRLAPGMNDWSVSDVGGSGMKLMQFFPGKSLGYSTILAQTSVMQIVSAFGAKAEARGDGSVDVYLKDGWHLIFHHAVATFTISFGEPSAT